MNGIIFFSCNFQIKPIKTFLNIEYDSVGLFYSSSATSPPEKRVFLIDIFSYAIPSWNQNFLFTDIIKNCQFIDFTDTVYIDDPEFRPLLINFFKDPIQIKKTDLEIALSNKTLPVFMILDLFLSKLTSISPPIRTHFNSIPSTFNSVFIVDLFFIMSDYLTSAKNQNTQIIQEQNFLIEKYKSIINQMLTGEISLESVKEFNPNPARKILVKDSIDTTRNSSTSLENLDLIFRELILDIRNKHPPLIDINFLFENLNVLGLNLPYFKEPFSIQAGIYSHDRTPTVTPYSIIPYNYNLESLSIQILESLLPYTQNELKQDIKNTLTKKKLY